MKSKSKFKALPATDQEWIFQLCQNNTFEKAVEVLEKPRPEGLALKTSYSAVRRFYLQYNPDAQQAQTLSQYAKSLRIQHQDAKGNFDSAILLHVQKRILEALAGGRAVSDLQTEIKTLINLQKVFMATEKWRIEAGDNAMTDRYELTESLALAGKEDFKPALPGDDTPFVEEREADFVEEDASDERILQIDQAIATGDIDKLKSLIILKGFPATLVQQRRELHRQKPTVSNANNGSSTA